eukprot:scaffold12490_cov31-Attheya_sp.AAC.2
MLRPWCRRKLSVIRGKRYSRTQALPPKAFQSKTELKEAVDKYLKYYFVDAEEFAQTHGWPIGRWDVSHVEDFRYLFNIKVSFNENIGSWDVSNVKNMDGMFYGTSKFSQDLSSWNVSNVTSMGCMFWRASNFNQDLSSWNVSNVTNMACMFDEASNFNQDISSWVVSNVTTMAFMFHGASNFSQDLSSWDVSNVTEMPCMFYKSNFNQDLSSWDVSNVTNMAHIYNGGSNFTPKLSSLIALVFNGTNMADVRSYSYIVQLVITRSSYYSPDMRCSVLSLVPSQGECWNDEGNSCSTAGVWSAVHGVPLYF